MKKSQENRLRELLEQTKKAQAERKPANGLTPARDNPRKFSEGGLRNYYSETPKNSQ